MIGSTISEPISLKVGSPQGAILSPSIFIILISDMELYCQDADLCGYADDTSITVKANSLALVKEKCETEVKKNHHIVSPTTSNNSGLKVRKTALKDKAKASYSLLQATL